MSEAPHRLTVRVYYEDTDFSGAVYHANYLRFMERGRTEFIRARGVEQSRLVDEAGQKLGFVVRHLTVDFLRPARMDDELLIETRLREQSGAALMLDQRVVRGAEMLVEAAVRIVLVGASGRPRRFPPALKALLFASD